MNDTSTMHDNLSDTDRRGPEVRREVDDSRGRLGQTADAIGHKHAPDTLAQRTEGSPLIVGAVAFGIGFLAAAVIKPTEPERHAVNKLADAAPDLRNQVEEAGQELASSVRANASDAAEEVKSSVSDSAATVKDAATDNDN